MASVTLYEDQEIDQAIKECRIYSALGPIGANKVIKQTQTTLILDGICFAWNNWFSF
jgi:hypothetical protein